MSSRIVAALQVRIETYLTRLRQALGVLAPEEIDEIVREIRGHIVERAESTDLLDDAALEGILSALGNPEDIGLYINPGRWWHARASALHHC